MFRRDKALELEVLLWHTFIRSPVFPLLEQQGSSRPLLPSVLRAWLNILSSPCLSTSTWRGMPASRPHVVAVPMFAQGHINPLMELCKQLAAHGCRITFINSDVNHLRILHSQHIPVDDPLPSSAVPFFQNEGLDFRFMPLRDGCPPLKNIQPPDVTELVSHALAPSTRDALSRVIQTLLLDDNLPVTCLVSDVRLAITQDVANEFGIPRIAFWTQSAASFASHLIFARGYRGPEGDTDLITCIPGAPPHLLSEVSFMLTCDPSHLLFEYAAVPFQRLGESALILINTFDELEKSTMAALLKESKMLTTGPLLPSPFFNFSLDVQMRSSSTVWTEESMSCLNWLNTHAPASVLYVSFGTLVGRSQCQIIELIQGLEASELPFLWVCRPDLTSGISAGFLEDILHRTRHRSKVVPWAPQLNVLSHPGVGGFLSHCGWNATLESITTGVPVLAWPTFADQPLNARFIAEKWKIGMTLEMDGNGYVEKGEVEKKVNELMKGEKGRQARENIVKLRDAARRASATGGSSSSNFELFLDRLRKL